jgi:hypothetical protein
MKNLDFEAKPPKMYVIWSMESVKLAYDSLKPKYFPLEEEVSAEDQLIKYATRELKRELDAQVKSQILPNRKTKKI